MDGNESYLVPKVVPMKLFLLCFLAFFGIFQSAALASDSQDTLDAFDSVDGNRISEPTLKDYVQAERTPGFSLITDVVD